MTPFCWERISSREAVQRRNVLSGAVLKTKFLFHKKFQMPRENNLRIFWNMDFFKMYAFSTQWGNRGKGRR